MASLEYPSISSEDGGTRDVAIDFSDALETSETISTVDVTSSDDTVLTATGEIANTAIITKENGDTIAIGKGVQFQIAAQTGATAQDILLDVIITGDSGTKETYEVTVPVIDKRRA